MAHTQKSPTRLDAAQRVRARVGRRLRPEHSVLLEGPNAEPLADALMEVADKREALRSAREALEVAEHEIGVRHAIASKRPEVAARFARADLDQLHDLALEASQAADAEARASKAADLAAKRLTAQPETRAWIAERLDALADDYANAAEAFARTERALHEAVQPLISHDGASVAKSQALGRPSGEVSRLPMSGLRVARSVASALRSETAPVEEESA